MGQCQAALSRKEKKRKEKTQNKRKTQISHKSETQRNNFRLK